MLTDNKLYFGYLDGILHNATTHDAPPDSTPVGSVEFVKARMTALGMSMPEHMTYPTCLLQLLKRNVWKGTFGERPNHDVFVKPLHDIKLFTGALYSNIEEKVEPSVEVWYSEPVKFVSEWRYYILGNSIVGAGRYDDGDDDMPEPDIASVLDAVYIMSNENNCPAGYALDFGILDDGRTALIEANDGWAIGYYKGTCTSINYAKLLNARWQQLLGIVT